MHTHRQCSSFIYVALAIGFLDIGPPASLCTPWTWKPGVAALSSARGPELRRLAGLRPSSCHHQRPASFHASCSPVCWRARPSLLLAVCSDVREGGGSLLYAFLFQLPQLQHSYLPWRVAKCPNILTETEYLRFSAAIKNHLTCHHHLMCHAVVPASVCTACITSSVSACTGYSAWLESL